jgi:hypothetical protein
MEDESSKHFSHTPCQERHCAVDYFIVHSLLLREEERKPAKPTTFHSKWHKYNFLFERMREDERDMQWMCFEYMKSNPEYSPDFCHVVTQWWCFCLQCCWTLSLSVHLFIRSSVAHMYKSAFKLKLTLWASRGERVKWSGGRQEDVWFNACGSVKMGKQKAIDGAMACKMQYYMKLWRTTHNSLHVHLPQFWKRQRVGWVVILSPSTILFIHRLNRINFP